MEEQTAIVEEQCGIILLKNRIIRKETWILVEKTEIVDQ